MLTVPHESDEKRSALPPASGLVIEVRGLRMRYGTTDVLRGVDFTVRPGEVVTLLGPNGAGKTTTIEIMEGFRKRSAGEVSVLGADPEHGGERWRAGLGVVLQSWRDHGKWRVRDLLVHFGQHYAPYSTPERRRPLDADELIEIVGLERHATYKIARLSGGQRRRLDVAIGIIGRPALLFLDEPTVGFDPEARRDFHALVRRLSDLDGTAILLTTHDLDEAEKVADRILILAGGQIVADGAPDELARQVAGQAEVRWRQGGERHTETAADPTDFARELFAAHGKAVTDLEIQRPTLEDTYLALVRQHERSAR